MYLESYSPNNSIFSKTIESTVAPSPKLKLVAQSIIGFIMPVGSLPFKVTDLSNIEYGFTVSPTGQSGNWMSKHYDDQAEMFAKGQVRKMLMNESEIRTIAKDHLILKPK